MDETFLYQQIAADLRRRILDGELKPGDRLPSVRQLAEAWNCTVGTVQRAFQELAGQELIVSQAGRGTHVTARPPKDEGDTPLRRAALFHRAEGFLLEAITGGYSPAEVESAVRAALDRWRTVAQEPPHPSGTTVRCAGSHDLALTWLASRFPEIVPGYTLNLTFSGSLGGLIALAEGQADLAGCHLWDAERDDYNAAYVRRVLPGRRVALLTLAHRRLGLIVPPGNPRGLQNLEGLAEPGLRFANRQPGSGTRVWLDAQLRACGLEPNQIAGAEFKTHSEVARAVAEGQADAGLGLEAAALGYGLGFVFLRRERFDLAVPAENLERPPLQALAGWLQKPEAAQAIAELGGYDVRHTGQMTWVT